MSYKDPVKNREANRRSRVRKKMLKLTDSDGKVVTDIRFADMGIKVDDRLMVMEYDIKKLGNELANVVRSVGDVNERINELVERLDRYLVRIERLESEAGMDAKGRMWVYGNGRRARVQTKRTSERIYSCPMHGKVPVDGKWVCCGE